MKDPSEGCSASAMTERLLHSMVSLSGKLRTEIVELLDLLGSSCKEDTFTWWMSKVTYEHGNVLKTTADQVHSKICNQSGDPIYHKFAIICLIETNQVNSG